MAPGVMLAVDWLHTRQLRVLAVGQAINDIPPFAPHPATALGSEANAVVKADVVARPVIVAVAALVHVFAATAVVGSVTVMLEMLVDAVGTRA